MQVMGKAMTKTLLSAFLAAGMLAGAAAPAFAQQETAGDLSRKIADSYVLRSRAYAKQAMEFQQRAETVGPGEDGVQAMQNAVRLLQLAQDMARKACAKEPYYIEKGIGEFRCSAMK